MYKQSSFLTQILTALDCHSAVTRRLSNLAEERPPRCHGGRHVSKHLELDFPSIIGLKEESFPSLRWILQRPELGVTTCPTYDEMTKILALVDPELRLALSRCIEHGPMGQALRDARFEPLKVAAEPVLAEIRRDLDRVDGKVKILVRHIYQNLFDPDLTVKRLKIACRIRDNSVVMSFHFALGRPPKNYIQAARIRTAKGLLSTRLRIWEIAELLGYSSLGVFSKAFERWEGIRPLYFRRQVGSDKPSDPLCERALAGELSAEEAADLLDKLRARYPEAEAWTADRAPAPSLPQEKSS